MEEYINEALNSRFIHLSTSQAWTGFFFMVKKDGGLRLCIDYQGIVVKNRYQLMTIAFELLELATIFTN